MSEKQEIILTVSLGRPGKKEGEDPYYEDLYQQKFLVGDASEVAAQVAYFANKMFLSKKEVVGDQDQAELSRDVDLRFAEIIVEEEK